MQHLSGLYQECEHNVVDGGCEMSGCNVRGALGSQARIGEVRELACGFRISKDPDESCSHLGCELEL